jgi:hypothetical protein
MLGKHHEKPKVNLRIPRTALTKDIMLLDCDTSQEPPKCKSVRVNYIKGSEIIETNGYCAEGFEYQRDVDGIGTCKEKQ